MKIYISLPISTPGYEEHIQRRIANKFQKQFEAEGHEVINPFILGDLLKKEYKSIVNKVPTYEQYMIEDLANLNTCDAIFFCDGYYKSKGCMEEFQEAVNLGLKLEYENTRTIKCRSSRNISVYRYPNRR